MAKKPVTDEQVDEFEVPQSIEELIKANRHNLTDEEYKAAKRLLAEGKAEVLSEEVAEDLFTFYIQGKSLLQVARIAKKPHITIVLTAFVYNWEKKRIAQKIPNEKKAAEWTLRDLSNNLLALSQLAMQKDTRAIMAGEMKIEDSRWVPKNIKELREMLLFVASAHNIELTSPGNGPNITVNTAVMNNGQQSPQITSSNGKVLNLDSSESKMSALKFIEENSTIPQQPSKVKE